MEIFFLTLEEDFIWKSEPIREKRVEKYLEFLIVFLKKWFMET
jgi:hypothetical protein